MSTIHNCFSNFWYCFFVDPEEGYKPPEFGRGLEQSLEAVSSPEPDDAEADASTTPTPEEVKDQSDSSNLDADLLLMDQNLELIYDWKIFSVCVVLCLLWFTISFSSWWQVKLGIELEETFLDTTTFYHLW